MSVVSEVPSDPHLAILPRRSSATAIPTRSVAVANGDEDTDDADISVHQCWAEIDRRVMVIVEEAGAAQPLEYRLAAREVDGGQVPSSGIARPRSTAGIRILGVGVDETVRERHLGHDRRYRFLVVRPDGIA